MKQKPIIQKLVLLTLMLLSAVAVSAREFTIDGITYRVISETDKTCAIKSADNTAIAANLSLPSVVEISGRVNTLVYDVIEIEYRAFQNCDRLVSVSIPASINYVGLFAFQGCSNLESVRFEPASTPLEFAFVQESTEPRSSYTFSFCKKLYKLTIGRPLKSAGDKLWCLYWGRLYSLTQYSPISYVEDFTITEMTILDGTDISTGDDKEFELFSKDVRTLKVGKNIIGEIGYNAYKRLNDLVMKESQPDADAMFSDRQYLLTKTYVPKGSMSAYRASDVWSKFYSMNEYDGDTFNPAPPTVYDFASGGMYFNLLDTDELKCAVTYSGMRDGEPYSTYSGDVVIPSSVTINGITIDVKEIGREAFSMCGGLTAVTIPASLSKIGYRAFYGCENLAKVTFEEKEGALGFGYIQDNIRSPFKYETFQGCNIETLIFGRPIFIIYDVNYTGFILEKLGLYPRHIIIPDGANGRAIFSGLHNYADRGFVMSKVTIGGNLTEYPTDLSEGYFGTIILRDGEPWPCPVFSSSTYTSTKLLVPNGCVEAYKAADGWKNFLNISESGESGIEDTGVTAQKTVVGRYDLSGRQVADDYSGVTIIRYSDGSVEKTLRR